MEDKKDTKITTLRCAISYINSLSSLLDDLNCGRSVSADFYRTDEELGIGDGADEGGKGDKKKRRRKKKKATKKRNNAKKTNRALGVKKNSAGAVNKRRRGVADKCLVANSSPGQKQQLLVQSIQYVNALPNSSNKGMTITTSGCPTPSFPTTTALPPTTTSSRNLPPGLSCGIAPTAPAAPSSSYSSSPSPPSSLSPSSSLTPVVQIPLPRHPLPRVQILPQESQWCPAEVVVEEDVPDPTPLTGVDCFVAGHQPASYVARRPQVQVECSAAVLQDLLGSIENFEAAASPVCGQVYVVPGGPGGGLDQLS